MVADASAADAGPSRERRRRVRGARPNNYAPAANGNGSSFDSGNSSASYESYNDKTTSNGRARSRRRRRAEERWGRTRRKKSMPLLLGVGAVGFVLFMIMWESPSQSSLRNGSSSHLDSASANIKRVLSEVPDNTPLTEEQEQAIVHAAHDELNRFPISIGTDEDGANPDWETIEHPGIEVRKHFQGESYTPPKKKANAAELAGVLSGKKLKGGKGNAADESGGSKVEEGYMRVPKFWDPLPYKTIADEREKRGSGTPNDLPRDGVRRYLGNFGSRLMTPTEAKSIGSRVPSSDGSGEMLETIFVAVASYRDWQCSETVESALSRASHPERIRVAVVDQIHFGQDAPCSLPPGGPCDKNPDQATCKYQSHIDYFTVDAHMSMGPVFARHLGHRLYRGEYFAMQSDAHVAFVKGWDDEIIEQWHSAKNEMAILSTYLSGTEDHIDLKTGKRTSKSRPIMCMSDFEGAGGLKHLRHGQQPEGVPFIHDMPTLNPYWAAGFSFGRGHFVVNVPYDQHLPWIFQGEEISIGLRGFSYGYDFYSPEKSACYHFYGRKGVPMFWENSSIYHGSGVYGMNRLNAIIHMSSPSVNGETKDWIRTDELKYGIGKVRDMQTFFDTFGIHVEEQRVEGHLCRFVGRPMQKEFIPFLRTNEMGLDYDKITYRFADKWKNEK